MTEKPKTVRVRIACIINADGQWSASGWHVTYKATDEDMRGSATCMLDDVGENHDTLHWIEADVPIPVIEQSKVIEGKVVGK